MEYYWKKNAGVSNELEFVNYLNGKMVKKLNPMFYGMIRELFGKVDWDSEIRCFKNHKFDKVDIFVVIDGVKKGISIKMGMKNSVHVEGISSFIHFLIMNGVDRESVVEYLKFHYADGSTNGMGKNRMSGEEYKALNQEKIDMINLKINDKVIVERAIDRFVLRGNYDGPLVDMLVWGTVDDFVWISREDIIDIIVSKISDYSSGVHFGSLFCQPLDRCLNYNEEFERKRFCVQLKWYSLFDDIIENMNRKYMGK